MIKNYRDLGKVLSFTLPGNYLFRTRTVSPASIFCPASVVMILTFTPFALHLRGAGFRFFGINYRASFIFDFVVADDLQLFEGRYPPF